MEDLSVLVIGGAGMLGHKVFQRLRAGVFTASCCVRCSADTARQLAPGLLVGDTVICNTDVTDWTALELLLKRIRPTVVVNCVGVIKQRSEAHLAEPSIGINSLLPHRLATACSMWNGRLIHFSTDCVFSGQRGDYAEDDTPDALDLYGRTKALGEVLNAPNVITLRTSMIGRELAHFQSLLEWFLSQQGRCVPGYTRAIYSGVTTNYLAELVVRMIVEFPDLSGLYQVVGQPISKYDLLCRLRDAFGMNVEITPDGDFACNRSMKSERLQQATGIAPPSWDELIQGLVDDRTPYEAWRKDTQQMRDRHGMQVETV